MPELPEVEIMCRNLATWCVGRSLREVVLLDDALDSGGVAEWVRQAAGASVRQVWRRGKYAVLGLDGRASSLVLHFRMTGKVVAADPSTRRAVRLALWFEAEPGQPSCVAFVDQRRLGNAWAVPDAALERWFTVERKLGPEPWPEPRSGRFWRDALGHLRSPIKVALMRQDRVAGLGNIAASEILWRAGVSPVLEAGQLSDAQWAAVAVAAPAFIEDTIEREQGDEIAYVNSRGGSGRGIPSPFSVYRCEGQPCPRCAAPIGRMKQSGRSTFWCSACQRS